MKPTRRSLLSVLLAFLPVAAFAGTETRAVSAFRELEVSSAIQVTWEPGEPFASVEAEDDVLPLIRVEQHGDRLVIRTKKNVNTRGPMRVTLRGPALRAISANGASQVRATGLTAELRAVSANGASRIVVTGAAVDALEVEVNGASRVDTSAIAAKRVTVDVNGASQADVRASESLRAEANGASQVVYRGRPADVRQDARGASRVSSAE